MLRQEWQDVAKWREMALAKRFYKLMENLSEHTKDLPVLSVGGIIG